jgi:hypothetical protein
MNFSYWNDNEKIGWHQAHVSLNSKNPTIFYSDIINWLYDNVENCYRHCRWRSSIEGIDVKFRYEKDYIMFILRWL